MPASTRQQVEQAFRIARKWRWYGLIPSVPVFLVCFAYAFVVPASYSASATISVNSDSPTNPLLRDLNIGPRRRERLAVVVEAIHSYTILEGTVQEVGVGTIVADSPGLVPYVLGAMSDRLVRSRTFSTSQAVNTLDSAVQVHQWGPNLIEVRYTGLDPEVAADVTNILVDRFVRHSSIARRRGAQATTEFIEEQLAAYKLRLEDSEAQLRAFREQNLDVSPTQFSTQVRALTGARSQEVFTTIQLREAEQRIALLKAQLEATPEKVVSERVTSANPVAQEIEARLVETRVKLATLRTNYTEKHPEILRLQGQIVDLTTELDTAEGTMVTSETSAMNPAHDVLVQRLNTSRIEYESLKLRLEAMRARITDIEGSINTIPEQEQQLAQLTRDSQVNERVYELLLQKLQEANISQQLAEQERGSDQFRIIDAARPPGAPSGPNRLFLLGFALVAGIGTGTGAIFARQYMDESFDDAEQLVAAFDLPCLAVIPRLDEAA